MATPAQPLNSNLYSILTGSFLPDSFDPLIRTATGQEILYREIDVITASYAAALAELGVARGDRVLVQVEKSPEALWVYLASLRLGAIYCPLNTAYTASEVSYFLDDAEPTLFLTRPDIEQIPQNPGTYTGAIMMTLDDEGGGSLVDMTESVTPLEEIASVDGNDIAAILYTSGTTGQPKGAMLSHNNLSSNALALHKAWGFQKGDVLLHALPLFHVHGLFVAVHCAMLNASSMLFLPRFDAEEVVRYLPQVTVMMGVPTFYSRLLEVAELDPETCNSIRLFISGSAPLLPEIWHAFRDRTGFEILERYGMTEAGMITSNPLDGERLPGTVGYPLPKVEVRVTGVQGKSVDISEVGMLELRGPNVFQGYWRKPEKTKEEFSTDGFFVSGDLATMAADGRVSIVGRQKDLVISGGLNIYPKEIEEQLNRLEGIMDSAVIGVPHPDLGEALVAVIVGSMNNVPNQDAVIASLKNVLAGFKVPRRVIQVDELPRNAMGKVQKNILREHYRDTLN